MLAGPEASPFSFEAFKEAARTPLVSLTEAIPESVRNMKIPLPVLGSRPDVIPVGGAITGAAEVAESLTSPENIALMATLGLAGKAWPIVSRLASAGFSGLMLGQAVSEVPELKEALNSGDEQQVARVATRAGLTSILGGLTAW